MEGRTPDFRASESKADAIVNIIEHFKETLLTREERHQTKGRQTDGIHGEDVAFLTTLLKHPCWVGSHLKFISCPSSKETPGNLTTGVDFHKYL